MEIEGAEKEEKASSLETNLEVMKLRKLLLNQMEFTHKAISQCSELTDELFIAFYSLQRGQQTQ